MARLKGPLFSLKARKQVGKELTYKTRYGNSMLTKYNKPGSVAPFTPSASQIAMRKHYYEAVGKWRSLTLDQKNLWRAFVMAIS